MTAASAQYQYELGDEASQRDALVLQYLPLVRMMAKRIHDRCPPNVSLDDLVSTGVIGLMKAIDNFDPSLKVQLKTYAERRIPARLSTACARWTGFPAKRAAKPN